MHCAIDQFINCAAFDKLHIIWSISQHTCNRVRVRVKVRIRFMVSVSVRVSIRLRTLRLGLGLRNWPNVQCDW